MKQVIDPKSLEIVEIKSFEQVEGLAARICQEKYDWIIVAGGEALCVNNRCFCQT